MIGQHFGLLGAALRVELLDGGQDASVQRAPPRLQQAPVGHAVGEGVREAVFEVGKEARLEQELRLLEPREPRAQRLLGHLDGGGEQREGHVLADDGGGLQEPLLLRPEAVDAGGDDGLHGGGHLDGGERLDEAELAALAHQHLGLDERPDALLEEERIALGALDEETLHRRETLVLAHDAAQELIGPGRRQRVEAELGVVTAA